MAEPSKVPCDRTLVGIDEAGYGPNLGPLVVAAVAIDVPATVSSHNLRENLAPEVSRKTNGGAVRVDDSKKVFSPGRRIHLLEQAVLGWLSLPGPHPASLQALNRQYGTVPPEASSPSPPGPVASTASGAEMANARLGDRVTSETPGYPWCDDVELPLRCSRKRIKTAAGLIRRALDRCGYRHPSVICSIVPPEEFNQLMDRYENKSRVLFHVGANLMRHWWNRSDARNVRVVADKQGGRDFYAQLLQEEIPDSMVLAGREGKSASHYVVSQSDKQMRVTFEPRADANHLLVALASMFAKYLREIWMIPFNEYWARAVPGLKATAGYPVDSHRFRKDIATAWRNLEIPERALWRFK